MNLEVVDVGMFEARRRDLLAKVANKRGRRRRRPRENSPRSPKSLADLRRDTPVIFFGRSRVSGGKGGRRRLIAREKRDTPTKVSVNCVILPLILLIQGYGNDHAGGERGHRDSLSPLFL